MGTVATKRPPTVRLSAFHSDVEGQQLSPGKQRQLQSQDPNAAKASTKSAVQFAGVFISNYVRNKKKQE
jgi:hypothetical protein